MKYTYSDDEDAIYSDSTNRRSARNTGTHTPADTGPVTTSSGRQIRAPTRLNGPVDESAPASVQGDTSDFDKDSSVGPTGRPRRSAAVNYGSQAAGRSHRNTSGTESDEASEAEFGDDEGDVDAHVPEDSEDEDEFDEEEAMVDDDLDDQPRSLMVKLSITAPKLRTALEPETQDRATVVESANDVEKPTAPLVETKEAPISELGLNGTSHTEALPTKSSEAEPETPAITHVAPLAFRGSPEKAHAQPASRPLDVVTQK